MRANSPPFPLVPLSARGNLHRRLPRVIDAVRIGRRRGNSLASSQQQGYRD